VLYGFLGADRSNTLLRAAGQTYRYALARSDQAVTIDTSRDRPTKQKEQREALSLLLLLYIRAAAPLKASLEGSADVAIDQ
jgi:hypothetical protein